MIDQIEQRIPALIPGNPVDLCDVWAHYDRYDPLAVHLSIADRSCVFARDLLADGLDDAAGEGLVRCYRADEATLIVTVEFADERRVVELAAESTAQFLDHTYALVARGEEVVDVDQLLRGIAAN